MKKIKFILFGVCLEILLLGLGIKYTDDQTQKDFLLFNNARINGEIESVSIVHHRAGLKVKNDSSLFIFAPFTNQALNDSHIFENFAERGDKVYKPAHSDTLQLIKGNSIYKYTFDKVR